MFQYTSRFPWLYSGTHSCSELQKMNMGTNLSYDFEAVTPDNFSILYKQFKVDNYFVREYNIVMMVPISICRSSGHTEEI